VVRPAAGRRAAVFGRAGFDRRPRFERDPRRAAVSTHPTPPRGVQVSALISKQPFGIPAAHLTSSTLESTKRQVRAELERTDAPPALKLLYCTPERLTMSTAMLATLGRLYERGLLARFVVDEVRL
jgi:hypothetical protein